MKVRYKDNKEYVLNSNRFSILNVNEILTDKDSIKIAELEVFLPRKQEWKDMIKAFRDRDIVPNLYNTHFLER